MIDPCLPIGALLALPEEAPGEEALREKVLPGEAAPDSQMAHVRACPRCRSLLAAARGFATREQGEACPGEGEAVLRIQAVLKSEILDAEQDATRPERRLAVSRTRAGSAGGGGIAGFLRLALGRRFVLPAFGAAAIAIGGFLLVRDELPWSFGPSVLREEPGVSSNVSLSTLPPRALGGGEIELRWRRSASAETYRVRFLDAELREVGSLSSGAETLLVVPAAAPGGSAVPFFWQVEALSQGDKIGDSVPMRWSVARVR